MTDAKKIRNEALEEAARAVIRSSGLVEGHHVGRDFRHAAAYASAIRFLKEPEE